MQQYLYDTTILGQACVHTHQAPRKGAITIAHSFFHNYAILCMPMHTPLLTPWDRSHAPLRRRRRRRLRRRSPPPDRVFRQALDRVGFTGKSPPHTPTTCL